MSFKTELHCHTSDFSSCAHINGADTAEKYVNAGYRTLVITNHFVKGYHGIEDHAALCHKLFDAADIVRKAAGDRLHVLTGFELNFADPGNPNDYLVYGLTLEDIVSMPDIFDMSPAEFHEETKKRGALVIQAHPFRFGMRIVHPSFTDGVEVFNGHPGHDSHNEIAKMWGAYWMEQHDRDYILTSGTDHHDPHHVPDGGIESEEEIVTMDDLIRVLKSHKYFRIGNIMQRAEF